MMNTEGSSTQHSPAVNPKNLLEHERSPTKVTVGGQQLKKSFLGAVAKKNQEDFEMKIKPAGTKHPMQKDANKRSTQKFKSMDLSAQGSRGASASKSKVA